MQNKFIHHVYFWLNNPESKTDKATLLKGLKKLRKVPTIKKVHIGIPAATSRGVIDTSYAFSWLCVFDTPEDQDIYQTHPIHLAFVETCKHTWSKVIVYDSISAV